MLKNIKKSRILINALVIIVWPIASLFLASAVMTVSSKIFGYYFQDFWVGSYIRLLTIAFIEAGFLAYYGQYRVSKITAFLSMALVPCLFSFFYLPFSTYICFLVPWIVFMTLKSVQTDWGLQVVYAIKKVILKRQVRISVSMYLLWILLVFFMGTELCEEIFGFSIYSGEQALFFLFGVPFFVLFSFLLFFWCKKAQT